MDWMPQAIREGIFTILFISGPLVILAAGLGLAVGILQAATQVQEQTLGSAVKIIGLFLAIIIFGFYMFGYLRDYTTDNINRAFVLVPQLGKYIMPRRNFLEVPYEEDVLNPLEAPTTLIPPPPSNTKGPQFAKELALPDIESTKKDSLEGPLGIPEMQRKKVGTNSGLVKQNPDGSPVKEVQPTPVKTSTQATIPAKVTKPVTSNTAPKTNTQTNTPITKPVTVPVIAPKPAPPIATKPSITETTKQQEKKETRKSLTDSLSKLRKSINDLNEYNSELEEAR